jgi:hypothetical protein
MAYSVAQTEIQAHPTPLAFAFLQSSLLVTIVFALRRYLLEIEWQ